MLRSSVHHGQACEHSMINPGPDLDPEWWQSVLFTRSTRAGTFGLVHMLDLVCKADRAHEAESHGKGFQVERNGCCWRQAVPGEGGPKLSWPGELWELIQPPRLCTAKRVLASHGAAFMCCSSAAEPAGYLLFG